MQICFRCDVLLLVVPTSLYLLLTRRCAPIELILHGSIAAGCSLIATVTIDSVFWGRWLWPEGEVFYFNAILQKSSSDFTLGKKNFL